jgi:hypothetical protein
MTFELELSNGHNSGQSMTDDVQLTETEWP